MKHILLKKQLIQTKTRIFLFLSKTASKQCWFIHQLCFCFLEPVLVKGLNMLSSGPKVKCGTMDAYFDKEFRRLYEGEKPPKRERKKG